MTEYERRSLHFLNEIDQLLRVLIDEVRRSTETQDREASPGGKPSEASPVANQAWTSGGPPRTDRRGAG